MTTLIRTNVTLPEDLLEQVDELAGARGRSRYIVAALTKAVRRDRQQRAFAAAAGAMVGKAGQMSAEEVLTFVNGLRDGDREVAW
jgi:metal-responsive CopG/Arc/MetJ family transcriptional regulator